MEADRLLVCVVFEVNVLTWLLVRLFIGYLYAIFVSRVGYNCIDIASIQEVSVFVNNFFLTIFPASPTIEMDRIFNAL